MEVRKYLSAFLQLSKVPFYGSQIRVVVVALEEPNRVLVGSNENKYLPRRALISDLTRDKFHFGLRGPRRLSLGRKLSLLLEWFHFLSVYVAL